ncbi:MAG TPA: sigma-54 dependent transcriptional regulator [Oligoflexia bacterium]|nr:sigma-54 dependent transcriptional regulator [Oligoflexia bacterium]HMP27527.1 sigma-54 dependent transcriptional regulator [Oligoflexia bacterium]
MVGEKAKILIVDDDRDLANSLKDLLAGEYDPYWADNPAQAVAAIKKDLFSLVICDLALDEKSGPESGLKLVAELATFDPALRIIVLTGHSSEDYGVRALAAGAHSFLGKPARPDFLKILAADGVSQTGLRRLRLASQDQVARAFTSINVCGASHQAESLRREIAFYATTDSPLLIIGESGVGKSRAALLIHQASKRSAARFVCAQPNNLSAEMALSELFGHKKGAFTGADQDRSGLLKQADGGTLLIDEIDALPLEGQTRLLGALQDGRFRPLGSDVEVSSNFRLITTTNQNVETLLRTGKLREDFYYRVAHSVLSLPPLRDRLVDLPSLFSQVMADSGESFVALGEAALELCQRYKWRGNLREFAAVVYQGAARARFAGRSEILPEDLKFLTPSENNTDRGDLFERPFHELVEKYKRHLAVEALAKHQGNLSRTAEALRIDRATLRKILMAEGNTLLEEKP